MPNVSQPPRQITAQSSERKTAPIRPVAVRPFVDRMEVWVREALSPRQEAVIAPYRTENEPAPFHRGYRHKLFIAQPSPDALRALSGIPQHMIILVELALDWIFDKEVDRDEAKEFFDCHSWKLWHRGKVIPGSLDTATTVKFAQGVTRYSDPCWAPTNLAAYHDKRCKLTGEPYCVHVEWRLSGRQACQHAGIESAANLLDFDHRTFWEKRLTLASIDLQRLGRLHRKYRTSSSGPRWIWTSRSGKLRYDKDLRIGAMLFNIEDRSIQKLLDRYGRRFRVRDCLQKFDVAHLLPR